MFMKQPSSSLLAVGETFLFNIQCIWHSSGDLTAISPHITVLIFHTIHASRFKNQRQNTHKNIYAHSIANRRSNCCLGLRCGFHAINNSSWQSLECCHLIQRQIASEFVNEMAAGPDTRHLYVMILNLLTNPQSTTGTHIHTRI